MVRLSNPATVLTAYFHLRYDSPETLSESEAVVESGHGIVRSVFDDRSQGHDAVVGGKEQWGLVNGSSAQDSVPGREGDFILDAARLEADGQHGVVVIDVRVVSHSHQPANICH